MKNSESMIRARRGTAVAVSVGAVLSFASAARADDPPAAAPPPETPAVAATAPPAAPAPAPVPPPPPYSLPWQLRPVTVANVLRSDTAVAFYDNAMGSGSTVATMLLASYKLTPSLAPMVRMGFVQNGAPGTAP